MPIRQGGVLASRASTWPRDHFCRGTMAPRLSRPMTWKEFLPISMPATAIAVLSFEDIACSLSLAPLASVTCWRGRSTAGPFHYHMEASLGGKWLELLTEIAPGVKRATIMFNPDTAPNARSYYLPSFEAAARS